MLDVSDTSHSLPTRETRIGKYRVRRVIGRGGMATVVEAEDLELGRTVALKTLPEDRATPTLVERFHREARIAAQLHHPSIVGIHEVATTRDEQGTEIHFIAMELVPGRTLAEVLAERGLPRRRLLEMLQAVAEAVAYAHERGVVHRDLKPGNVLVDGEGKVLLTDFGLAHAEMFSADLTQSKELLGTPQYMAPEQVKGRIREIDERTDVYALGVMLYEILTGRAPFSGRRAEELFHAIVFEQPEPPRRKARSLDRDAEVICLKALEKERSRRYASGKEFAEDLRRYLNGEAIHARPPSVAERLKRAVIRHRWGAGVAAGAVLLAIGFAGVWKKVDESRRRAQAERSEESRKREEAERRASQMRAEAVYRQAGRDLYVMKLRQYQSDWRMTEDRIRDFERVEQACRGQMTETGESAEGWWIVGRIREVGGDWTGALEAYEAGLVADSRHGGCLLGKARLLTWRALVAQGFYRLSDGEAKRAEGQMREAVDLLERGLREGKAEEIELDLAAGYMKVVQREPTSGFCDRMLEKWKGRDFREEFYLIRGLGHPESLVEDATRALEERRGFAEAYFWRSLGRMAKKDWDGILQDSTQAIEINPRLADAYLLRGDVYVHQKDLVRAIRDFTKAISISPRFTAAHSNRGMALCRQSDFAAALRDFSTVLEIDPHSAPAYANRGFAHAGLGDSESAIADFTMAIDLHPRMAEVYYNRGLAYQGRKEIDRAIEDYTRAIEVDPKHAEAHNNRGILYFARGDPQAAIRDFSRTLELDPRSARAYGNRARAFFVRHDYAQALEDYTKLIHLDPNCAEHYRSRGHVHVEMKQTAPAIEDYSEAIRLDPGMADAYVNRGVQYFRQEDHDRAVGDFSSAIRLNPGLAEAYNNRANVYARRQDYPRAIEDYSRALGIEPRSVSALFNRSAAWQALGKKEEAIRDLQHALQIAPEDGPHRAQIEEMLKSLGARRQP